MADRTVAVRVSLLAQDYFNGLRRMQDETRRQQRTAEQAFAAQRAAFDALGKGALVASGLFAGAFIAMVKASADFEQRMSQVQTLSKATAGQMSQLRDAAFTAGKAFGLSATQVADAEIELTKAGVATKDIIGGALPGALALAAAGQIDVAKATEIASNAMTEFKLSGKDVPHVADLLAASADKSVGSVDSVGDALNQSGLVAAQFGLSIEDTVGTLTAFSKAGLNGSDAGTSFKTMLLSLASPSKQAQKALDAYNITAYDSQGKFVGITNLADQLHDKLGKLSQAQRNAALSTIFGTDAIRTASVLYQDGGKKLQGFIDANNEAGFATLQASKKLDNLNGDVQKLGASFQNDLIRSGSGATDVLRGVAQTATGLLDVFGDLPKPIQGSAVVIAGVGAAVAAAGAGFLLIVPKIAAARVAMADLNITARGLALGVGRGGVLALGITAIASGLAAMGQQGETTSQQLNLAAESAKGGFGNLNGLFKGDDFNGIKSAADALTQSFSGDFSQNIAATAKGIDGVTFGLTHFGDTYKSNEGQFKALGEQLAALSNQNYDRGASSFNQLVKQLGGGNEVARQALLAFPAYREEIVKLLNASGQAATQQNILAAATGRGGAADAIRASEAAAAASAQQLKSLSGSAADASVNIADLSKTIAGFGSASLDARSAERAFEQAVDDASAAAKKNGRTLDISTEAGRANQAALDGIASSATAAASKILEQTGSQEQAAAAIRKGRKAFIDSAVQMGLTRFAAGKLADQLELIPSNVKTAVSVTGVDAAKAAIADTAARLAKLDGRIAQVYIKATTTSKVPSSVSGALIASGRAAGGSIEGPGPKGKDSVLAYLAPGEHVLTAREVDKMGGQAAVYAFRKGINAYAKGGAIGDASTNAKAADDQARALAKQLAAAKKNLTTQQHQVDAAQKNYDAIDGTKKHRAEKVAARAALKKQKDDVDDAQKKIDAIEKKLDAAKSKRDDAKQDAADLKLAREDFVSQERRGVTDPLSYVDQLRSMSRDDKFSDKRRATFDKAANKYESALVKLAKQSEDAATKLSDLKSSADSMQSSIQSAITGGYQLNSVPKTGVTEASTKNVASGWAMRDGVRYQTYNTVDVKASDGMFTSEGIQAYYQKGATDSAAFAADLKTLAGRGLSGKLLAELAGYGVEQGAPIAKALLTATSGQLSSINANYAQIGSNATDAANFVTDVNYKALIDSAQKNADQITKQIADDSDKLRKLIASAFGLTGYAIGTMAATPGWHLVGERGPELLRFAGGEQVLAAAQTRALMAGATTRGNATPVVHVHVTGDDSVIASAMRVVAEQTVATNNHTIAASATWGGVG